MLDRKKGGIDLNDLNMQTSGEATQINFDVDSRSSIKTFEDKLRGNDIGVDQAMMNRPIHILIPRIIHIGDVNVMDFLGLNEDGSPKSSDHADQTADIPKLSFARKNGFD